MGREEFGATAYDRERRLKSGGYRITTTMDINAQQDARDRISDEISEKNKNALLLAAVEPGTGKVRLLAANRKYKLDDPAHPQNSMSSDPRKADKGVRGTYPNTTNPLLSGGGDITGYQAGSVFKMFTMVAALEKGYPLGYTIKAEKRYKSGYIIDPSNPSACDGTHFWCPGNAGERRGRRLQHVERLRQLGEHVLRSARGTGRRGERGGRRQTVRRAVPRRAGRRAVPARPGQPVGRVHPGRVRVDPARHGQRVRDPGR